jgi:hypothetical protein
VKCRRIGSAVIFDRPQDFVSHFITRESIDSQAILGSGIIYFSGSRDNFDQKPDLTQSDNQTPEAGSEMALPLSTTKL